MRECEECGLETLESRLAVRDLDDAVVCGACMPVALEEVIIDHAVSCCAGYAGTNCECPCHLT